MTHTDRAPAYISRHWAKSDRQDHRRIHLLEHHLADVGACFEALLSQPTIRKRLARTAGLDDLDRVTVARLAVFAALHDIGKVNVGFQAQIWSAEDLPAGKSKPHRTGHTLDLTPILTGDDERTSKWFFDVLGWEEVLQWDNDAGLTACALFVAALSHHGIPLQLEGARHPNPRIWRPYGQLDPRRSAERIGMLVRQWFPDAFSSGAPPLPSAPAFQHMFLGLCTLADWIGSDESHFEFCDEPQPDYIQKARTMAKKAISGIGLDISDQRHSFSELPAFSSLFGIDGSQNAIQRSAIEVPLDEPVVIIESETGSGKTESALWRFAHMYEEGLVDGLYFALPTRAAASQLHRRVEQFVKRMFIGSNTPLCVLAVPGYLRAGEAKGRHLPDYQVWWEDDPDDATKKRRWAAEHAKRYLAAQIAVGTVDQAMMAALQVRHSHVRAASLARNLLVVDEVHASDPYMRVILEALLEAHVGGGGYALLMSATLGSVARRRWLFRPRRESQLPPISLLDAIDTGYPAISFRDPDGEVVLPSGENHQDKTVRIDALPAMHDFLSVAERALDAARAGAKVLLIRNTVPYAVQTHRAIEGAADPTDRELLFSCRGISTLHTGRFAAEDRKMLDEAVEARLGKERPRGGLVVVGTQTLEQSLDIDADLLITDLCPMDVLLQRIGRLHRHTREDRPSSYASPTCIVLTPTGDDLSSLISSASRGSPRNGLGTVYPDLGILELTRRPVVKSTESGEPWNIPKMNRELVERTTHPEPLNALTKEHDAWIEHRNEVEGVMIADNLTAKGAIVRRDKSFLDPEVVFADVEERIRTRLGDEGIEIRFDPAPPSPFDRAVSIARLTIPGHMSRGLAPDETIEPAAVEGGFEFAVAKRRFAYDHLGLRQA